MEYSIPDLPPVSGERPASSNDRPSKGLERLVEGLSTADLLSLRSIIDGRLPVRDLRDLDLSRELVLQTLALQQLQLATLEDDGAPANQKAQVANSLSASLVNLVKLQTDVYSSERSKKLEALLIDFLNALPDGEPRQHAFDTYSRMLEGRFGG